MSQTNGVLELPPGQMKMEPKTIYHVISFLSHQPADITIIKSMKNPPAGVKLVLAAVCVMKEIKPERIPDPNSTGRVSSFWVALWARIAKNTDWSTGPLARPFARTAHLFACSALLASLARSAVLTRSLARSLRSLPSSRDSD